MSAETKVANANTLRYKEIASEIVYDINEHQGANLHLIAERIHQETSSAYPKLRGALLGFIETYIQRRTFSADDLKERIDSYCKVFAKHRLHEIQGRATFLLAAYYKHTYQHYPECLEYFNKVELIAQKHLGPNSLLMCLTLFEKGGVYFFQGDIKKSTEMMIQAQSMNVFSKAPSSLRYMSHINLSRNYILMNEAEKAKKHLEVAEIAWEDFRGIHDKAPLFIRKSDMFRIGNDWEKALELLEEALEFYKGTEYKLRIAEIYNEIGQFYHRPENPIKNFDEAMSAYNEALILAKELNILRLQGAIYNNMWVACKYYEEWKSCADYMILHSKVNEQVHQEEIDVYIKKLEHLAMVEKQKMMQEGKPTYSESIIDEVMTLRKENESLRFKNSELHRVMTDIELLIEKKPHNGNGKAVFLDQLHEIIQKGKSNQPAIESYLIECENSHPEFSRAILKVLPNITAMELKIAKLIKHGLTTQSIATLCGVTVKSIENHRIRLRKKCNLSSEQSLSTFIVSIT